MAKLTASVGLLSLVVLLVGCDHGTKHLATRHLRGAPTVELIGGVLDLHYVENRDAAFNALRQLPLTVRRPVLLVCRIGLALLLLVVLLRRTGVGLDRLGMAVILAGGLGNLLDYLARGYVVDFIHVHHWPVFNVADICIPVGVLLYLIHEHRRWRAARSGAG